MPSDSMVEGLADQGQLTNAALKHMSMLHVEPTLPRDRHKELENLRPYCHRKYCSIWHSLRDTIAPLQASYFLQASAVWPMLLHLLESIPSSCTLVQFLSLRLSIQRSYLISMPMKITARIDVTSSVDL